MGLLPFVRRRLALLRSSRLPRELPMPARAVGLRVRRRASAIFTVRRAFAYTPAAMQSRVVCISATDAASGASVGRRVAGSLGFRYVDEQIVTRAAELAQVAPAVVAAAEKRQPLLQRIIDKLAAAQDMIGPVALG